MKQIASKKETSPVACLLDVMSCGFGAFILLFLIIKDQANVAYDLPENYLEIEISTLESEIEAAKNHLQLVSQSNASTSTNIFNLERQLADSQNKFRSSKNSLSRNQLDPDAIEALRKQVESMKSERARLKDHDTKPSLTIERSRVMVIANI